MEDLKLKIGEKLSRQDYYGMFEVIDEACNEYLSESIFDYNKSIELIKRCQDLYDFFEISKQFQMQKDLQNKILLNRNKLFIGCLNEQQKELKDIFQRCVGDYSLI